MNYFNDTKPKIWDVIVVGAGASGMMAALNAARAGSKVLILEHMESSGKKILATGNGKCNYTNMNQDISFYRSECPDFVLPILQGFSVNDTIRFFEEIGIYPKEKNGYLYPYSEQAASVLEAFLIELRTQNVAILTNIALRNIMRTKQGFEFETKNETFYSKACILATGGKSSKKTGSDGSGYIYAQKMGHHIIDPVPALVQLTSNDNVFQKIAGIRIQGTIRLRINHNDTYFETGEIQLTDYGVSGIPVFQVSRFAAKALQSKQALEATIDFFPQLHEKELFQVLKARFHKEGRTCNQTGIGLFPSKLYPVFLTRSGIEDSEVSTKISDDKLNRLTNAIKEFKLSIHGTKNFDFSQVTAGGIDTLEISNLTMESKLIKGLFFAGEVVDVDGACGGYNLQWAWSSGFLAGKSATEYIKGR